MRVIAGTAKSLKLIVPRRAPVRPTSDATREALFSSLTSMVEGSIFLDLYAGTGAVGLEALSRGAKYCAFLERHPRCVQAIHRNLENTGLATRATVIRGDVRHRLQRVLEEQDYFDLIFLDPPYEAAEKSTKIVEQLLSSGKLEPTGLIIFQHPRYLSLEGLPEPKRTRRFGETMLSFFTS